MTNADLLTPTGWFGWIIGQLIDGLDRGRVMSTPDDLVRRICTHLLRLRKRFERLVARVQAGTLRTRKPAPRPAASRKLPGTPRNRLPEGFAWLVRIVPGRAGALGLMLQSRCADPEMIALIEAAPEQFGRLLRPMLRMLAAHPPAILSKPAKPRAPRPRAPRPQAPPAPPPPDMRGAPLDRFLRRAMKKLAALR